MKWLLSIVLFLLLLVVPSFAQRHGGSHSGSKSSHSHKSTSSSRHSHGHIKRSRVAKDTFMRRSGYPRGRKGYVVDHVVPLVCGGADSPSNMQWQTKAEAKAKDKWERNGCK